MEITNKVIYENDIKTLESSLTKIEHTLVATDFLYSFYGTLSWLIPKDSCLSLVHSSSYITFLIELTNTLHNFLLKSKAVVLIQNYISMIWITEEVEILILNFTDEGNEIFISYTTSYFYKFFNQEEINKLRDKKTLYDPSLRKQCLEYLYQEQNNCKNLAGEFFTYSKNSFKTILLDYLPCFIENIYDIPKDSILWQTPLLQETMSNYEALKQYAIEKGWLTDA